MNKRIYLFSLYFLIVTVFFADWLCDSLGLIPRQFTWFSEIIILFLVMAAFKKCGLKKIPEFKYSWFLFSLGGLTLVSLILNHQNPIILVSILHKYFKYIVMGLALFLLSLDLEIYKKASKFLTAFVLIQLPISYLQRSFFASFSKLEFIEDAAGGTLGRASTDILSCVCAIFIVLFLKNFLSSRRKIYLFLTILMYIPAVYGSTKFSFFFYPLIFVFMAGLYFYDQQVPLFRKLSKLGLVAVIIAAVNLSFIFWHDQVAEKPILVSWIKNPRMIIDYELEIVRKDNGSIAKHKGRIGPLMSAYSLFKESPQNILFGFGGCSVSESFLGDKYSGRLYNKGVSIYKPSFVKILVEFGILGLLLYLSLLFRIFFEGIKSKNYLLPALSFVLLGMSLYTATWDNDLISFLFWFLLAADLSYKEISLD